MSDERLTARLTGRVQGVGFRWWARRQAEALKLTGWVMNSHDERAVELVAEGRSEDLDELVRRLEAGPPGAQVQQIDTQRGVASGEFSGFQIVRS